MANMMKEVTYMNQRMSIGLEPKKTMYEKTEPTTMPSSPGMGIASGLACDTPVMKTTASTPSRNTAVNATRNSAYLFCDFSTVAASSFAAHFRCR